MNKNLANFDIEIAAQNFATEYNCNNNFELRNGFPLPIAMLAPVLTMKFNSI